MLHLLKVEALVKAMMYFTTPFCNLQTIYLS